MDYVFIAFHPGHVVNEHGPWLGQSPRMRMAGPHVRLHTAEKLQGSCSLLVSLPEEINIDLVLSIMQVPHIFHIFSRSCLSSDTSSGSNNAEEGHNSRKWKPLLFWHCAAIYITAGARGAAPSCTSVLFVVWTPMQGGHVEQHHALLGSAQRRRWRKRG